MELFPPPAAAVRATLLATELTEEQVQEQQPAIRGQLIQRLEWLWKATEAEIERGELEQRLDPRFVELGMRTLDRIMKLYRLLETPKAGIEEAEDEAVVTLRQRQQIEQQLRDLEKKVLPAGQ